MIPTLGNRLRRASALALLVTAVAAGPAQAHVYSGVKQTPSTPHVSPANGGQPLPSGHIVQHGATAPVPAPVVSQSSGIDWTRVMVGSGAIGVLLMLAAAGGITARRGRMVQR